MARGDFQINWGTALALLVSFAALITTIYEANILKAQQEAMVWPYFEVSSKYSGKGFSFEAKNSGTGPAIITSVECTFEDEPIADIGQILDRVNTDTTLNYYSFNYRSLNQTVFTPGEERVVFLMPWSETTRKLAPIIQHLQFKVEYRSVLGDYWVFDTSDRSHREGRFKSRLEFQTD